MLRFNTLWMKHPNNQYPEENFPCCNSSGVRNFENQCAIRMGIALQRAGVSMSAYSGKFCNRGHGRTHTLRVTELAKWLKTQSKFIGKHERRTNVTYEDYIGKSGIVVFWNFWGRYNQGDHIDLWTGYKMAHGDNDYFERSQAVWFWELD
jgi:hypothetical protein